MQIFEHATIIPVDEMRTVLTDGALVIDGSRIIDLGDSENMRQTYPRAERIDCRGDILLPGLINTHIHLAQSLLRGMADELPLFPDWLCGRIWPMQASYTPEEFLISARIALCEMMRTGTTTFVEPMIAHHYGMEGLVDEVTASGMRGMISKIVMDGSIPNALPAGMVENREASFRDAVDAFRAFNGAADGRIGIWLGPRWTGIFDPNLFSDLTGLMKEYGFHTDIHYAEDEEDVLAIRRATGLTPGEYLVETGLAGKDTLVIHGTHFAESDYRLLAETGTSLSHCPASTMTGSLGYPDIPAMQKAGVNISLGTDAMACDNTADLFLDMRIGSLLQRHTYQDPKIISAWDLLEMATIGGARAIGMEDRLGSLAPGKQADFLLLDTHQIKYAPNVNPVSNVVYAANGNDVRLTVIAGKEVCRNGELLTMDEERCIADANRLGRTKYEWLLAGAPGISE